MSQNPERRLWRFILHPFEDDDASAVDLGSVHGVGMDNAYMRGIAAFVAVGDSASDIAARRLGGKWKDYPDAFFTVAELELPPEPEMTENYPFAPEAF